MIAGEGFKEKLENYGYVSKEFINIGLPRTSLLIQPNSKSGKSKYRQFYEIKKKRLLVVCFGLMPISDFNVGLLGEDGTSVQSCIEFVETIFKLAIDYPNLYFLIRHKIIDDIFKVLPKSLLEKIESMKIRFHQYKSKKFGSSLHPH